MYPIQQMLKLGDHAIMLCLQKPIRSHAYCTLLYVYYFLLPIALWTILCLMPTTSHPKAIGGVC